MASYLKIGDGVDVLPLLLEVQRQPHLWDRNPARLSEKGPHHESHDIWLRYKDEAENKSSGDYSNFSNEHDAMWYPSFYCLPSARRLIFGLMARVEGERIGGVLLYNIPAGRQVYPHVDTGWHVDYYDKFNICLQSNPDTVWFYEGGEAFASKAGEVHWVVNNIPHWVVNNGKQDHIVMTVCLRCDRLNWPKGS